MDKKQEFTGAMFILLCMVTLTIWMSYHNETGHKPTLDDFYNAIGVVESNNDDMAWGSHGEQGRYQITEAYFQDAVEFANLDLDFADCMLPSVGRVVIESYMRRYASEAWHDGDWHSLARIHHGGWNGMKRKHTKAYADRVVAIMGAE